MAMAILKSKQIERLLLKKDLHAVFKEGDVDTGDIRGFHVYDVARDNKPAKEIGLEAVAFGLKMTLDAIESKKSIYNAEWRRDDHDYSIQVYILARSDNEALDLVAKTFEDYDQ